MNPAQVSELQAAANIPYKLAVEILPHLIAAWAKGNITTPANKAMFIAQCGHESGFVAKAESLNYSPSRLTGTWPKRFNTETAKMYGRKPGKPANQPEIARIAYGNRMGNNATTDGWKHRGYGWIQHTGLDEHRLLSAFAGVDFVNFPEKLLEPQNAAMGAAWFWVKHGLSAHSEKRDVLTVSRIINCGPNASASAIPHGLADREQRFKRAYDVLTKPGAVL